MGLAAAARSGWAGFIRLRSIKPAINVCVARHDLHVLARLGERNRVHEFGGLAICLARSPQYHAVFPGIVRGQRRFRAAKLLFEIRDIDRAEADIVIRIDELGARIANFFLLAPEAAPSARSAASIRSRSCPSAPPARNADSWRISPATSIGSTPAFATSAGWRLRTAARTPRATRRAARRKKAAIRAAGKSAAR